VVSAVTFIVKPARLNALIAASVVCTLGLAMRVQAQAISGEPDADAGIPDVAAESGEVAEQPVSDEDSERALGAVVVTARYRSENAQAVPIAITSLSEQQLKAQGGTRSLSQYVGQLPSLNVQGFSGRNQTITIRGLGTNAGGTNDGLEQGVGLYIDGVYRARTGSVITDLVDIESIQLLRGPQGTLFGKNTVAGAVDIHTLEPGWQRLAKAEFSYGNYNYVRGYFSLTNPVTDWLTFRLSYLRTTRDGLFYNTRQTQDWDNLSNDSVRADVLMKPSDNFKTRLIADYSMQACNCGFYVTTRVLPTTRNDGSIVPGYNEKAARIGYQSPAIDPFGRKTDIDASQADRMPSWGIQNRADLRLDSDISLTSITAYRNWQWLPHYDGDGFGADIMPASIVETHQQQFSQELRLASPGDKVFDYTAGLYFFWQRADDKQIMSWGSQASAWLQPVGTPSAVLDKLESYAHVVPETASYAAYGQATWNPSDSWHFTGGLRLTHEYKHGSYNASARGDVAPIDSLPAESQMAAETSRASYAPTASYKKSIDVNNLSWTLIGSHAWGEQLLTFVTYSRGYKSPGINLVAPAQNVDIFVKPEEIDDFEIGAKATMLDGLLELNPTLFYAIDRNYQANYVDTNVMPIARGITNVGTLVSRGVEVDARLFPIEGVTASASGTYNDAYYASYKSAPAQYLNSYSPNPQDLSGRHASGAPRWSAAAMVEYARPVIKSSRPADTITGYVSATWTLRSSFRAAVNLDPYTRVPGYTLLGMQVGLRAGQRWDVSLWMRNILDTQYYNTLAVNANYGIVQGVLGEPRLFGVTVRGQI
jgi:iron complex outermembrane recepter protein